MTFTELLIVVLILAIMTYAAVSRFQNEKAYAHNAVNHLKDVFVAEKRYFAWTNGGGYTDKWTDLGMQDPNVADPNYRYSIVAGATQFTATASPVSSRGQECKIDQTGALSPYLCR